MATTESKLAPLWCAKTNRGLAKCRKPTVFPIRARRSTRVFSVPIPLPIR